MRVSGVTLALVLASALVGAAAGLWPTLEQKLPLPASVTLGGRVPGDTESLSTWVARRADREAQVEIALRHPDGVLLVPRSELGLELDVQAAVEQLSRPRPRPGMWSRLRLALGGPGPEPVDVPPSFRLDAARASAWLSSIAAGLRVDPIDARLDLAGRQRIEAASGRELDLGASLSRLAALGAGDDVELAFTELAPKVPTSALVGVDPSVVLSEYETDFAKRGGPRVKNIARAARYLDGTLMAPGEVWSFNRTVGPRTLERGFVDAPVIVADEMEEGVGGGVCQVASTLFAASVLGGLDAAVIDGELDLQLRNPYPVPIIVHAYLPTPTRIRVEMLGVAAPGKIEHSYAVTKSEDFYRRVARRPELAPDKVKRHQKGIPGYDVVSIVRTRYSDGSERVRRYSSTYYPVPEVYWIGNDVDPETLPSLPERATHTELPGETGASAGAETTPASFSP